jgi:pSer/pThr/pTyr-binding forkhead associated (FHA) protein
MEVALIMFKETGEPKRFPIEAGKTIIGRKEDCGLRIPLGEISRRHAVLMLEGETIALRDLGSANGTYVNNQRITEQELSPGDHIVIGPVVFTVQINGEPKSPRPVQTRLEARPPVAPVIQTSQAGAAAAVDEEDIFDSADSDPISALEALAGSDDTDTMDLGESDIFSPDDSKV